jgi:hypothetical protein
VVVSEATPFPIDAVYTWVDLGASGRSEAFTRRLEGTRGVPPAAWSANRFRDLGTLAWSIRALLRFAPWIRTVHVVTSGAAPPNLPNDPRIRVVGHGVFFRSAADLPTFNSYAIEANLCFVPDLAERFIYLNDDMFLGRPAERGVFFDDEGRAICRFDDPLPSLTPFSRLRCRLAGDLRLNTQIVSALLAEAALADRAANHPARWRGRWRRVGHQASASRASALRALWDHPIIGPLIRARSARPFRGWDDLCPFTLMALMACDEGTAVAGEAVPSATRFLRDRDLADSSLFQDILDERPALFCLNDDVRREPELARKRIDSFLSEYLGGGAPI